MAEASHVEKSTSLIADIFETMSKGIYLNTFSERGRRQIEEIKKFKEAASREENRDKYHRFCTLLLDDTRSCLPVTVKMNATQSYRENSCKSFYQKRLASLPQHWKDIHDSLQLPQPDPLWTQTVNRLLFDKVLVLSLTNITLGTKPQTVTSPDENLGVDEENVIRYIAGYIPFKLLKVYQKKNSEEAASIVDCLSSMAVSGEESFDTYTSEWTKAISRGGIFEVNNAAYIFFRRMDVLMRNVLPQHLATESEPGNDEIVQVVMQDDDLLFNWAILSGHLSNHTSVAVLKEIIIMWMTIRGHALAKQLLEEYKCEKGKVTRKSKSLRKDLHRDTK